MADNQGLITTFVLIHTELSIRSGSLHF